jgi:hypothetical protein
VRLFPGLSIAFSVMVVAAGCDNGLIVNYPSLVTDTITLYAPATQNAGRGTAMDISSDRAFGIAGLRFPEKPSQAGQWDLTLRVIDNSIYLVPQGAFFASAAAITPPITDQSFDSMIEIPGISTFRTDTMIALQEGQLFAARSRDLGSGCIVFAKLQPLTVDVENAKVFFRIVTNESCSDPRLMMVE